MKTPPVPDPQAGELYLIGARASVQFAGARSFVFRVIRAHDWTTYEGWIWLDGYQLNAAGDAVERRSIFVQRAGLVAVVVPAVVRPAAATVRRPRRTVAAPRRPTADRSRSSRAAVG